MYTIRDRKGQITTSYSLDEEGRLVVHIEVTLHDDTEKALVFDATLKTSAPLYIVPDDKKGTTVLHNDKVTMGEPLVINDFAIFQILQYALHQGGES